MAVGGAGAASGALRLVSVTNMVSSGTHIITIWVWPLIPILSAVASWCEPRGSASTLPSSPPPDCQLVDQRLDHAHGFEAPLVAVLHKVDSAGRSKPAAVRWVLLAQQLLSQRG